MNCLTTRIAKVTLNRLGITACLLVLPASFLVFSSPAEAAPRTTGRPGRTESAGRRAVLPPNPTWLGSQLD